MPKQIQITIPKPCHENWEEMTPVQQGAYCKACQKNVIDFTRKTENEIYEIVTNAEEDMCGRFTAFQLEQPVLKTEVNNGLFNWRAIAASLAALVTFKETYAQQCDDKSKTVTLPQLEVKGARYTKSLNDSVTDMTVGRTSVTFNDSVSPVIYSGLKGKVIDAGTKEPIYMATVYLKSAGKGVLTDTSGSFQLIIDGNAHRNDTVVIKYIGYTWREIPVAEFIKDGKADFIEIKLSEEMMGGFNYEVFDMKKKPKRRSYPFK